MFEAVPSRLMMTIKKYAYSTLTVPSLLVLLAYKSFDWFELYTLSAFMPVLVMFVGYGFMDLLVGRDPSNPSDDMMPKLNKEWLYTFYLFLCLPLYIATLVFGAHVFTYNEHLTPLGQFGWALSIGSVGSILAVTAGHELVHRSNRLESTVGGILYSLVCYGNFKIEHVRGHHVNVATPHDNSTAKFGQSLYAFIPRAVYRNIRDAWKLEAERLARAGYGPLNIRNEMIWWTSLSVLAAAAFYVGFGMQGTIFFLVSSAWAFLVLETANYVQHYGLRRNQNPDGSYESIKKEHSWNSNFVLSNLSMFQLQRHSHHHANAKVPYQSLRHYDDCPQLPAGYPLMMLISCVPPLWRRIMDPRVKALYGEGEPSHSLVDA